MKRQQKSENSDQDSKKIKTYFDIQHFINDTFCHIGTNIFIRLDDQSLVNCKLVCKKWLNFIEKLRFPWHREINAFKAKCKEEPASQYKSRRLAKRNLPLIDLLDKLQVRDHKLDYIKAVAIEIRNLPRLGSKLAIDYLEILLKISPQDFCKVILDKKPLESETLKNELMEVQAEAANQGQLHFFVKLGKLTETKGTKWYKEAMDQLCNPYVFKKDNRGKKKSSAKKQRK